MARLKVFGFLKLPIGLEWQFFRHAIATLIYGASLNLTEQESTYSPGPIQTMKE